MQIYKIKKTIIALIILFIILGITSCTKTNKNYYNLLINIEGQGKVIVIDNSLYNDNKLDLSYNSYTLEEYSIVKLNPEPEEGYKFMNWSGPDGGSVSNDNTIEMNTDKEITAIFKPENVANLKGKITVKHNFPQAKVDNTEILSFPGQNFSTKNNISQSISKINIPKTNEIIINFNQDIALDLINHTLSNYEYKLLDIIKSKNSILVSVDTKNLQSIINELHSKKVVNYAEKNAPVFALSTNLPDDEFYQYQWHYPQIRLPQAWSITTGSNNIRIAVLDTGINFNHPDLQGQVDIKNGYDFVNNNNDASDINWHGTHVAGIIGAKTNNSEGVAGVMWDVELLPVKVLENDTGSFWSIAAGIYYAAGLYENLPESFYNEEYLPKNPAPVDIINMSLGTSVDSNIIREAVQAADKENVIMVAAAGNNNLSTLLYPANYPEVISVGSTDFNYPNQPNVTKYSHKSSNLDIVAPGGNKSINSNKSYPDGILSTTNGFENYSFEEGTSMAAPHVSGIIGLMLSEGIQPQKIRNILHRTAIRLGDDNFSSEYGHGLINAYWAINDVQNLRVIIGNRSGNQVDSIIETTASLKGGNFKIDNIPPGPYKLIAWIDVGNDNKIQPGDYYYESDLIEFKPGQILQKDIILEETIGF